jgi:hypothetical protein
MATKNLINIEMFGCEYLSKLKHICQNNNIKVKYFLITVFAGHKTALEFRPHGPFWARKMILSATDYKPPPILIVYVTWGLFTNKYLWVVYHQYSVYNVINGCICDEI